MTNSKIKFGTDGWRAIIAEDFTIENLEKVALATATWIRQTYPDNLSVVVGYDCRFMGEVFAKKVAHIFTVQGIEVRLSKGFCSTPMVSLATTHFKTAAGIIITASHNPPTYSGYKIKGYYGGPAYPAIIEQVEDFIENPIVLPEIAPAALIEEDFESLYVEQLRKNFDIDLIRRKVHLVYDAMFGAGQNIPKLLRFEGDFLHCEFNPSFLGQAPEPIHKNLALLSKTVSQAAQNNPKDRFVVGLATDGDADRIGLYDENGRFIDSHHILLLLIHYLYKVKGIEGKVVTTFSCTQKIADLCAKYGLSHQVTQIGFKYICEIMLHEKVIVGGEESGGIAVIGHVPERDGIYIGLMMMEFMAKSNKKLSELVKDLYQEIGFFAMERYDLHTEETLKQQIIQNCKNRVYTQFGDLTVSKVEDIDGYKFHFSKGEWVMIRPSGTEPILRVYAEAESSTRAFEMLDVVKTILLS